MGKFFNFYSPVKFKESCRIYNIRHLLSVTPGVHVGGTANGSRQSGKSFKAADSVFCTEINKVIGFCTASALYEGMAFVFFLLLLWN